MPDPQSPDPAPAAPAASAAPSVRTVEQRLADAGASMLKRLVGHTALSARQRLRQVEQQFGRDALVAAIGTEAELTSAVATLDGLISACGVATPSTAGTNRPGA